MKKLQWVDVNKVGGVANWGERTNLAVGAKVMRSFIDTDGKKQEREETIVEIQRFDDGAHVVITSGKLPEPVEV